MDPKHKAAIQKNFQSLLAQTDLQEMVSSLYEKGVFAEHMIEQYKNRHISDTNHKRNFYLHLMRRGPEAFKHLIQTLWEKGLWNLADDLDPAGEFHDRPQTQRPRNDEGSFISLSTKKKEKAKSAAEIKKSPPPLPPAPPAPPPLVPASNNEPPSFVVKKSTQPIVDEGDDIKMYAVGPARRQRVMLLYTYMNFEHDAEAQRGGADRDSDNLKYLFYELGFEAVSFCDQMKEETLASLRSLPTTLAQAQCVFVVVSSHGYSRPGSADNDFRCSDGLLMSFYDFIEHFSNERLPHLLGVPKVFIFQTCRGPKKESSWLPAHVRMPGGAAAAHDSWGAGGRGAGGPRAASPPPRAPAACRAYSDILIAHSTVPGFVSNRNPKEGSWYIQTLCSVFAEHAHHRHVEELLTLVDQQMEARFHRQTSSVDKWGFNRRLYLQPGLPKQ